MEGWLLQKSLIDFPWRRKWHPTPVLLSGKSHGWRSLVGYRPWSLKELDMTAQRAVCQLQSPWLLPCSFQAPVPEYRLPVHSQNSAVSPQSPCCPCPSQVALSGPRTDFSAWLERPAHVEFCAEHGEYPTFQPGTHFISRCETQSLGGPRTLL